MASFTHYHSLNPILCFLLLVFPYVFSSQTNISVGSFVVAGGDKATGYWLSPSGDFAFGFSQVQDTTNSFLLTAWFNKIQEKTIVWYAKESDPVPKGSRLEVTSERGLVINDPKGGYMWSTDIATRVSNGFFEDSGNFGLRDENSETTWESFGNPTDTILPGQEISKEGAILIAQRSGSNITEEGRFRLYLQNGTVQLKTVNLPSSYENEPYYWIDSSDVTSSNPGTVFGFSSSTGYLYLRHPDGEKLTLTPEDKVVSSKDYYLRATLEFDGVLIQYTYPKKPSSGAGWSALWTVPDDICTGIVLYHGSAASGTCGYNRICRLGVDHRPQCECPRGFLDQNDEYRGCVPKFSQRCEVGETRSSQDEFVLDEVANVDWPTADYELLQPFREDECKDSCLKDCMCAVAIFRNSDMCWKKKVPLSNGKIDNTLNSKAFIKRRRYDDELPSPDSPGSGSNNVLILAGSVLLGSSVFMNFILVGAIGLVFVLIYRKKLSRVFQDETSLDVNIRCFTYRELEEASNGFNEELGRGSFGIVYGGVIEMGNDSNSRPQVAIKKLDRMFQENEREFKTEVLVIGQTHHKNLVRLFGYCNEGQNRLLVYEYLSNGTLASFLFGDDMKPSWDQREQIALDIGKGLLYLHEDCSTQVIHCDIKPQNILLDENYGARISDFGLAKLLLLSQTHTNTAIRGTRGYVAPEWFRNMPITAKVDVYSFGILLLEIICSRRSVDIEIGGEEKVILADWAYDCYRERRIYALVENDEEAMSDFKMVERFVMVAIWCIQEDPSLRPTMKKVMLMLEGVIQVSNPPCPFPFSTISTV